MNGNCFPIFVVFGLISHVSFQRYSLFSPLKLISFSFPFQIAHASVNESPKYSGCDFDLVEEEPSILEYLSDECQKLSLDKQSDEYKTVLQEAHAFADFETKLSEYERRKDPNAAIIPDGSGIPQKQWTLRNEIYTKNNFFQCIKPHTLLKDVMGCMIDLRKNMSDSVVLGE